MARKYRAFTRAWWREHPDYPDGLAPCPGPRSYFRKRFETENEAREFCRDWNSKNKAGRLSVRAEFTSEGLDLCREVEADAQPRN